nr:S8 family peptidase [Ancylobacter tetraedralis]
MVPVARRKHGTSMASLIVHGDLGDDPGPIERPLTVVPVLASPQHLNVECTPPDKLPIAMVYRAVTALMEGIDGLPAQGENIVIVNHSICDREAPFAQRPSYWAKLLDHLSYTYRLLFVVSAGNSNDPFILDAYADAQAFADADPIERQVAVLRCVEKAKGRRIILSPAESMNSLTVGAIHGDGSGACPNGMTEPYDPVSGVTNITSSVGLGINRAIKPDMVETGGRQFVQSDVEDGLLSVWAIEHPDIGQLTAVPDPSGVTNGRLGFSTGTSNAAALITRAAIRLADVAEDIFEENDEVWAESATRAVVLKALLAHGCGWGATGELLYSLYPGKWQRRREAVSRTIGYGKPDHTRVVSADGSRITLLADDVINHDELHEYRLPVPRAMINNREIRRVTMTLAWSSPIDPVTKRYRGVLVEVVDGDGKRKFWDGLDGVKGEDGSKKVTGPVVDATRRGTLQHIVLEGKKLIRTAPTGDIFVGVQARADLVAFANVDIPYALAITLEMGQPVRQDLFADVAARVRAKRVAVPTRVRTRVRG